MDASTSYHFSLHPSLGELLPFEADWDALRSDGNPFIRFRYLLAMEESGSACAATGWQPLHATLWRVDAQGVKTLCAACPLYCKAHSYGEYVFDWAWARAYEQHGLAYYPKLLAAVPFTPVSGLRLLATDDAARSQLLGHILAYCRAQNLSGLHLLFLTEADRNACMRSGLMQRSGVQFHWNNAGWSSFEDFLTSLKHDKRKKIHQEQRSVQDAGIHFMVSEGRHISDSEWDFFYRCYTQTYLEHGNAPYLSRAFFQAMQKDMPESWLLFTAHHRSDAAPIACSLIALNTERTVAYGRYWGALARVQNLHFDACYYQPLRWCIEHGIGRFEGGAQGQHKIARALMPCPTYSAHWIAQAQFSSAISDFLVQEQTSIDEYQTLLLQHSPFKNL